MKKLLILESVLLAVLVATAVTFGILSGREEAAAPVMQTDLLLTQSTTLEETTQEETTQPGPTWPTYPADRELLCQQYFVYDVSLGAFVKASGGPSERVYPASITKLFTAYVATQFLQPEQVITVTQEVLDMVAWGSSVAQLEAGDQVSVSLLVEAMLLPSGNDAAYVLAVAAGRVIGSGEELPAWSAVDSFMEEMNRQAKAVGMEDTHFSNPDGIHDDNHYTTFSDLAVLGKLSLADPTIMAGAITASHTVTLGEDREIQWKNTNALVDPANEYYCPFAVGLKTGQTPYAGSCLLSAFSYEGRDLIIGVFGCPETEDRFPDTLQLFNETVLGG